MKASGPVFLCIVMVSALVFCAGCSSFGGTQDTPVVTHPVSLDQTPETPVPAASPPAVTIPAEMVVRANTSTTSAAVPVPTTTGIQKSSALDAADDPYVAVLEFEKNYFLATIPDCGMRAAFPEVAGKAGYGLDKQAPELVALSEEQMLDFLKANARPYVTDFQVDRYIDNYIDPNTLGGVRCAGVPATPAWNFILINANIVPRNARPASYDIGINVRSKGTVAAQLKTEKTLTLDQPVIFTLYVPMKTTEMDSFDSIEMVFAKKR